MGAAQPEVRFRVDPAKRERAEQIAETLGMNLNDAMKVMLNKFIAVGGLPFEMRQSANDTLAVSGERSMPVFGVSPMLLADVAADAARKAALSHVRAGRLPGSEVPAEATVDELAR